MNERASMRQGLLVVAGVWISAAVASWVYGHIPGSGALLWMIGALTGIGLMWIARFKE